MFYTTPVLVFPSNTAIAQYKTYYEQNGYVTNIFINLSLGHISNKSIIKINFLIKTWGDTKIIFIKCSIPKLMALHIISIKSIQRRHENNITTIMSVMQIIKLHRIFYLLLKHSMS